MLLPFPDSLGGCGIPCHSRQGIACRKKGGVEAFVAGEYEYRFLWLSVLNSDEI